MAIAASRTVSIKADETLRQAQARLAHDGVEVSLQALQDQTGLADPDQALRQAREISVFVKGSTEAEVAANLASRQATSVAAPSSAFSMRLQNVSGRASATASAPEKMNLAEAVADPSFAAWDPARIDSPQLRQIIKLLDQADSVLLVGHVSPDGDCVGSTLSLCRALKALGKQQVDICIDDELPGQLAKLDTDHEVKRASELAAQGGDQGWDLVLIMDVSEAERIADAATLLLPKGRAVAIADHHVVDPKREDFQIAADTPFVTWVEPEFPAAALQSAAMLARFSDDLETTGADLKAIYTPALIGFSTDTGFGRYQNLDREYFHYFKHMMVERAHSSMDEVQTAMKFELSEGIRARLLGEPGDGSIPPDIAAQLDALEAAGLGPTEERFYGPDGAKALAVLTCDERYLEVLASAAHAESNPHLDDRLATTADLGLVLKWSRMGGLRKDQRDPATREVVEPGFPLVALLTQGSDGKTVGELRSKDGSALELASMMGGGGHEHAAGFTWDGALAETRAKVMEWAAPRLAPGSST